MGVDHHLSVDFQDSFTQSLQCSERYRSTGQMDKGGGASSRDNDCLEIEVKAGTIVVSSTKMEDQTHLTMVMFVPVASPIIVTKTDTN